MRREVSANTIPKITIANLSDRFARATHWPGAEMFRQSSWRRSFRIPRSINFSRTPGVSLPHPESFYGLALPLGGAEISMQDLVRLYAALANNGELRPLRRISSRSRSRQGPARSFARSIVFNARNARQRPATGDEAASTRENGRFIGKRERRADFTTPGRLPFSIIMCLASGLGTLTVDQTRHSSDARLPGLSCFKSSTVCEQPGRSPLSRIFRRPAQI